MPFIISGPGIAANRHLLDVIAMVDIAPTLLQLAGVPEPRGTDEMDGRSFASALLTEDVDRPVGFDSSGSTVSSYYPSDSSGSQRTTMLVEFFSLSNASPETPPCVRPAATSGAAEVTMEGTDTANPTCYNLNVSHSDWSNNTFIGLRIINGTHDLTYAEYTQESDLYHFQHVYFKELYNLSALMEHNELKCADVATDVAFAACGVDPFVFSLLASLHTLCPRAVCLIAASEADPYQLKNIYNEQPQWVKASLHDALFKEFHCKGASCANWSI
eukprot:SAG31_NODE_2178_length_6250_cov_2.498456_5_plen_273_part_00